MLYLFPIGGQSQVESSHIADGAQDQGLCDQLGPSLAQVGPNSVEVCQLKPQLLAHFLSVSRKFIRIVNVEAEKLDTVDHFLPPWQGLRKLFPGTSKYD